MKRREFVPSGIFVPSTKNFRASGFLKDIVGGGAARFTGWESGNESGPRKSRRRSKPSRWIAIDSSMPVSKLPPACADTHVGKSSKAA